MIIKCDNCNKNFDIDPNLIPEKGRLLQCIACDHKWFFKKEIKERSAPIVKIKAIVEEPKILKKDVTRVDAESPKPLELLDKTNEAVPAIENISIQPNYETEVISKEDKTSNIKITTNKKNYNILGLTIVFIISFIAIIIVLDTFQKPISIFLPNIEFILYNLYETINDIVLFFNDLI